MEFSAAMILAVFFILICLSGLAAKILAKKEKDHLRIKGYNRFFSLGLTMGLIGLAYMFFAWQGVTLLGSRFWLMIWLAVAVVWKVFILKYLYVEAPKKRLEIEKRNKFNKYLP